MKTMKTIEEINNSLDKMSTYLFKNSCAFEIINLHRRKMYSLSTTEEASLVINFESNQFVDLLEYIIHTFQFYETNNVLLPISFKQKLILKYINEYDQIVSSQEDLFNYKNKGLTNKFIERSLHNA